jgi:glycolate oxidase FAD binding subunit
MPERFAPENEEQVRDCIRWAATAKNTVCIEGQGTKSQFGHVTETDCIVSLHRLQGIREYEPSELVMKAAAGTPLSRIEETLAERGQRLAFEPLQLGRLYGEREDNAGSIGGVFMGNLAGPRRFVAGAARDHLLGIRAVDGRGEIYKSGGKVIKNVTGYDISKLLAGSWGTLSVVTELSFKVLPAPETSATLAMQCSTRMDAMQLISGLAQSPYEITGLAYFPGKTLSVFLRQLGLEGKLVLARLEGTMTSIRERMQDMRKAALLSDPYTLYEEEISGRIWQDVRDVEVFNDSERAPALLKLSIPPAAVLDVSRVIDQLGGCEWYSDAASGWLWVGICHGSSEDKINTLRREINAVSGSAVLYRASEAIKRHVGIYSARPPALAELTRSIKHAFDPENILNPGRLGIDQ